MKHDLEFLVIMLLMMAGLGVIGMLLLGIVVWGWAN